MPAHLLIAYVDHGKRLFSLTARKAAARLPEVDDQMEARRFARVVIAQDLEKAVAETMKQTLHAAYVGAGYRHEPRPAV